MKRDVRLHTTREGGAATLVVASAHFLRPYPANGSSVREHRAFRISAELGARAQGVYLTIAV